MTTTAQSAAHSISSYLLTGMHHSTPEGQIAIAAIVATALHAQAAGQVRFWEECTRDILRDKDQQIAALTQRL